jgi:hypothetical protein
MKHESCNDSDLLSQLKQSVYGSIKSEMQIDKIRVAPKSSQVKLRPKVLQQIQIPV